MPLEERERSRLPKGAKGGLRDEETEARVMFVRACIHD